MGSTDYGNQIKAVRFFAPADSSEVNRIARNNRKIGIYEGGYLTKVTNTSVTLSPLEVEISGGTHQINIETQSNVTVTVSNVNIYVVLRWAYTGDQNDYMDVLATASPQTNDVIVGKCNYTGSTLNGFDYSDRTNPDVFDRFLQVVPETTPSLYLRVRAGRATFGSSTYSIADQKTAVFSPPGSNSRIDLVYINSSGAVSIQQGTAAPSPVAPSYAGKMVLAEVTLTSGQTEITESDVRDVRAYVGKPVYDVRGPKTLLWFQPDDIEVATEVGARIYVNFTGTITRARAFCKTGPVGSNAIFDLNKNGTSIFGASKLNIVAGGTYGTTTTFTTTAVAANDYFTCDIDQIGSSTAGADMTIMLEITPA